MGQYLGCAHSLISMLSVAETSFIYSDIRKTNSLSKNHYQISDNDYHFLQAVLNEWLHSANKASFCSQNNLDMNVMDLWNVRLKE